MALSKPTLANLIKAEFVNVFGDPDDDQKLQDFCTAIANAVVTHIQAAAVVTVSVPGVQSGGSTAAGTGTVS